jgi:hypothetical protein
MLTGGGCGGRLRLRRDRRQCGGWPAMAGAAVARRSATGAGAGLRHVVPAVTEAAGPRRPPSSGDRESCAAEDFPPARPSS